jgi:hypothetical protein
VGHARRVRSRVARKETDHFFRIMWEKCTYPSFPKHKQVDVGHVRKMIRQLGIPKACTEEHLPILKK